MTTPTSYQNLSSIPLPVGWEAKYDIGQRRYYFINHDNKVTTWEDPRIKIYEQQKQCVAEKPSIKPTDHTNQSAHKPNTNTISQLSEDHRSTGNVRSIDTHSPVHQKSTSHEGSSTSTGWQAQIEDKYGMKVELIKEDKSDPDIDPEVLNRIKTQFPSVGKDLLHLLFVDCHSEDEVRLKLIDMGYKEQKPETLSSIGPITTRESSPSRQPSATASPAFKPDHGARSVTDQRASVSPGHSINQKVVMFSSSSDNKTKSDSPATTAGRIKSKDSGQKSHHGETVGPGGGGGGQSTPKASPLVDQMSERKRKIQDKLEQEFSKTFDRSIIESTLLACSYDEEKTRFELQLLCVSTNIVTPVSQLDPINVVTTTKSAADISLVTVDTITVEPEINVMKDKMLPLRVQNRGPNPSLAKGPNKNLLRTGYKHSVGSQSSNYTGPSKDNWHGPSTDICHGPVVGLAKGPSAGYVTKGHDSDIANVRRTEA